MLRLQLKIIGFFIVPKQHGSDLRIEGEQENQTKEMKVASKMDKSHSCAHSCIRLYMSTPVSVYQTEIEGKLHSEHACIL